MYCFWQMMPPPVKSGIKWLDKRAIKSEGIWSHSGNSRNVSRLVAHFDENFDPRIEHDENVKDKHTVLTSWLLVTLLVQAGDVCGMVLRFLQMIPNGLLPVPAVEAFIEADRDVDLLCEAVTSVSLHALDFIVRCRLQIYPRIILLCWVPCVHTGTVLSGSPSTTTWHCPHWPHLYLVHSQPLQPKFIMSTTKKSLWMLF